MIGRGNLCCNLYILEKPTLSTSTSPALLCGSVVPDNHLWHQRLGHPSTAVLQKLVPCFSSLTSVSRDSSHCSICPLAKQKRLAFVSHNRLSDHPFDLVHIDIWGPFSVEVC